MMPPKLRRPAAAKVPPRPGRGARRRRPAAAGVPPEPVGGEVEADFDKGDWVEGDKIKASCLSEGVVVVAEGTYWGAGAEVAGKVTGMSYKGPNDLEIYIIGEGTTNEDLLQWIGKNRNTSVVLHLCGTTCSRRTDAHGFVHVTRLRKKVELDTNTWVDNMVETPDELARLRAAAPRKEAEGESVSSGERRKRKKEDAKKDNEKKGKTKKESATKEKKKKKSGKGKGRVQGQKSLEACFKDTGLDPDAKKRKAIRRRLRRRMKKKEKASSSSKSECSSSGSSSEGSSEGGSSIGEGVFNDLHRVRRVAALAPGVLATSTLREMQKQLLDNSGNTWDLDTNRVPAVSLQYFRGQLQSRLAGGPGREALTLCWALDLLVQGKIAACGDCLAQRIKALEMISGGATWSVAQRLEVVPPDKAQLSSRGEQQIAVKESKEEMKTRNQAKGKDKGKSEGYPSWRNPKGEGKGKEKSKGKKGDREEGKKSS